jgi:hypothetical protein
MGNNQAFDSGVARGTSDRTVDSSNFITVSAPTEALQADAYKGFGHPSGDGNVNVKHSDGFLAGMDRAINSVPEEMVGAQREVIGGQANRAIWDADGDGKVDVDEFKDSQSEKDRNHAGLAALNWGFGKGGDTPGDLTKEQQERIKQLADEMIAKNTTGTA